MSFSFSTSFPLRTLPVSYYDVLGVSPTASEEEIRRGYRKQLERFSPYRNVMNTPDTESSALPPHSTPAQASKDWELTLMLYSIYKTLMDPKKRAYYDASLWHAAKHQLREREEEAWKRTFYFVGDLFEEMQPILKAFMDPLFSSSTGQQHLSVWDTHSEVADKATMRSSQSPSPTSTYTVVVASSLPQASPAFQQAIIDATQNAIRNQSSTHSFHNKVDSSPSERNQTNENKDKETNNSSPTSNGKEKKSSTTTTSNTFKGTESSPRSKQESSITVVLPLRTAVIMSRL